MIADCSVVVVEDFVVKRRLSAGARIVVVRGCEARCCFAENVKKAGL
jgi:hypothetical protein